MRNTPETTGTQREKKGMWGINVNIPLEMKEEMDAWFDRQLVRPTTRAFVVASIREFLSSHP